MNKIASYKDWLNENNLNFNRNGSSLDKLGLGEKAKLINIFDDINGDNYDLIFGEYSDAEEFYKRYKENKIEAIEWYINTFQTGFEDTLDILRNQEVDVTKYE
jgi:hypothetical protein